jgi:hypothetical protein
MLNVFMLNVANNSFMLSVIMLSVVMLNVANNSFMLSVVMLSVVMLNVECHYAECRGTIEPVLNRLIMDRLSGWGGSTPSDITPRVFTQHEHFPAS